MICVGCGSDLSSRPKERRTLSPKSKCYDPTTVEGVLLTWKDFLSSCTDYVALDSAKLQCFREYDKLATS